MPDPAPRTRSAAELADHASDLLGDVQSMQAGVHRIAAVDPAQIMHVRTLLALMDRLVAQVEDLAAVVAGADDSDYFDHFCLYCGRGIDLHSGEVFVSLGDDGLQVGEEHCNDNTHGGHAPDPDRPRGPLRAWEAKRIADLALVDGPAPAVVPRVPTLTVREFLALFEGVDPDLYVTVATDGWWLNISGLHTPGSDEEFAVQIETTDDFDTRQW